MPAGSYYVNHNNREGILKSARCALDQTGQNQLIHDHAFGQECNDQCRYITDIDKGK